jgi:peroxiredoxin
MAVEVGQEAPDFTLKDQTNTEVRLSSFRGEKAVALVFYPFTFTGVCQGELCELRDNNSKYEQAGMQVLAVSCDSRHAQAKWAEEQGFGFPVLSDFWPHGEVAKAYGVFNEALGCANRGTFIIDKDGKVVDSFATENLATPRDASSYQAALDKL